MKFTSLLLFSLLLSAASYGHDSSDIIDLQTNCVTRCIATFDLGDGFIVPSTKKQAVSGVKVMNRHAATFVYNGTEISFKRAKKLVRKKFDSLIISGDFESEIMEFKDK